MAGRQPEIRSPLQEVSQFVLVIFISVLVRVLTNLLQGFLTRERPVVGPPINRDEQWLVIHVDDLRLAIQQAGYHRADRCRTVIGPRGPAHARDRRRRNIRNHLAGPGPVSSTEQVRQARIAAVTAGMPRRALDQALRETSNCDRCGICHDEPDDGTEIITFEPYCNHWFCSDCLGP
ncbi:uncharacterized protein N7482_007778 [Penicillium canariense]|uniref:RING-type domain-containing protein n=1 Tax=Penicillium canariense TaxID=189055 RepID=A0A9W9LKH2_9EURO|nr:uncharacterized protein N7482_007778 [Penicillium canariense]KAJ5160774.1 hypothetical protein N7482_007778 [Penicillium canariense]